jgi:hypothetical protein
MAATLIIWYNISSTRELIFIRPASYIARLDACTSSETTERRPVAHSQTAPKLQWPSAERSKNDWLALMYLAT